MMAKAKRYGSTKRDSNFGTKLIGKWLNPNWYTGRLTPTWQACIPIALLIFITWSYTAIAAEPSKGPSLADLQVGIDTMWVMITGMLVFFMNAGFCMLETGFCRQKNAVNILSKNLIVFAVATIAFWAIGFGLMFSNGAGLIGLSGGFFLDGADNSPATLDAYKGIFSSLNWAGVPLGAKFFFQLVFAGTAATIVSGAVAERIKFSSFLIFSLLLVGIVYPIAGHWIWGGGWLSRFGFIDFAGSTVVHTVGGWSALTGAFFLGPRLGKFGKNQVVKDFSGHNMSIATLGCLILWLGWFGFNPGSTMGVGDGKAIVHIALTTNTAAALGGVSAMLLSWFRRGKPDLSMIINGLLAGLVAITASCAYVSLTSAAIIGITGSLLVSWAVDFFDNAEIDDPVSAISVHLVAGVWGTLALGLFSQADQFGSVGPKAGLLFGGGWHQLTVQLAGSVAVGTFVMVATSIFWSMLMLTIGIRVSKEEELMGLDISEHNVKAYDFVLQLDDKKSRVAD